MLVAWIDGELALATGDVERAWRHGETALQQLPRYSSATALPMLRVAAAAARAVDRADEGAEPTASRVAVVEAGLAAVGASATAPSWRPVIDAELVDDLSTWRSVWAGLASSGAPRYLRPYAGLRLAQHLIAQRERVEARSVLERLPRAQCGAGLGSAH